VYKLNHEELLMWGRVSHIDTSPYKLNTSDNLTHLRVKLRIDHVMHACCHHSIARSSIEDAHQEQKQCVCPSVNTSVSLTQYTV
jgi:hypothetical protein